MKHLTIFYLLPLCLAMGIVGRLVFVMPNAFFEKKAILPSKTHFVGIASCYHDPQLEAQFLDDTSRLFVLGSSELATETDASIKDFFPYHFATPVSAVGHAGNQCFSIYTQLLANKARLRGAKIAIILSPLWIQGGAAAGTSPTSFLEFNSQRFLENILADKSLDAADKSYFFGRVADYYPDFTAPNAALKEIYFEQQAKRSVLHRACYAPLIMINKKIAVLANVWDVQNAAAPPLRIKEKERIIDAPDWDWLLETSKIATLAKATNNAWAIDNDYFTTYIKGNVRQGAGQNAVGETNFIHIVPDTKNTELQDFQMLVRLLKAEKVNASFIIIPMNPYRFPNLVELTPQIDAAVAQIKAANFPLFNMWVTDTAKFEKGILRDVMHPSTYGWYNIDRFLMQTYSKK